MNIHYKESVAQILIDIESVKFSFEKPFILTSGLKSPVYVDCRRIISYVEERSIILKYAIEYFKKNNLDFNLLAGGETAGIPYSSFLAELLNLPMIYIRKKPKDFGKNQQIEGNFKEGQKVLLIEDLATDGGSKVIFVNALREAKLKVTDIFVIFFYDIFDISLSPISNLNIKIHSLCTWQDILGLIKKKKLFTNKQIDSLEIFLDNPNSWRKKYE